MEPQRRAEFGDRPIHTLLLQGDRNGNTDQQKKLGIIN